MPIQVNVAGLTTIKIQVPSGGLLSLGYARNEPEIVLQPYHHDVYTDEFGGDQGPIVERQLLGVTALIRVRLTKYDPEVFSTVEKFASQVVTAGQPPIPGTLLIATNNTLRVLLDNSGDPRNFPRCFVNGAIEVNKGSKFSEAAVEFLAIENASGVLWNASIV